MKSTYKQDIISSEVRRNLDLRRLEKKKGLQGLSHSLSGLLYVGADVVVGAVGYDDDG